MAQWQRSTHDLLGYAEQWDELIGPLRWYRSWNAQQGAYLYCFVIEDQEGAAEFDSLDGDEWDWKSAGSWGDWPNSGELWDDSLTQERAAEAVVEPEPVPLAHEQLPALEGTRLADPTVASSAAPQYAPKGSYAWPVRMTVGAVQNRWSWIIQKVAVDDGETNATFWEAFPVAPDQADAANQDIYQGGPSRLNGGTVRVVGVMQHHVFAEALPPGMDYGGSELADGEQVASDARPPFWLTDDGTPHNLTFDWANSNGPDTLVSLETEPAAGAPVFKSHHTQLASG